MVNTRFKLEKHGDVLTAVVFEPLVDFDIQSIRQQQVNTIEIIDGKGWIGGSMAFVKNLEFIDKLVVRSILASVDDLDVISTLGKVKELNVQTYCKTPIDFSRFSHLRRCTLLWRDGCESLFECQSLESLSLIKYRKPQLPSGNLVRLQSLGILDSSLKSLDFLSSLGKLSKLRLGALYWLEDTDDIRQLKELWHLDIGACKGFRTLDAVSQVTSLRSLLLNDQKEIESLQPLKQLPNLEALFFCGTTKVLDGKVKFLRDLPNLKCISFNNRRHYDCKCESFPQHYAAYPFNLQD